MPRKKAELITDNAEFFDIEPEAEDTRNSYERMLDDLYAAATDDQSLTIAIYRQAAGGLNTGLQFCENLPADKFTYPDLQMYIKSTYGAGDYRLQVRVDGKLRMNKLVSIAMPAKITDSKGGTGSLEMFDRLLDRMDKQDERLAQLGNTSGEASRMDMLREMMLMKEIFSSSQPANGFKDMLGMLTGLKELGLNIGLGDKDEDDTSFAGFLGKMAEPLTKIMEGVADNQINTTQQKAEAFDKIREQMRNRQPNPAPRDEKKSMLTNALGVLVNAAQRRADPAHYADMVLDMLPEDYYDFIAESDDLSVLLVQYVPQYKVMLEQHKEWFAQLHAYIKQALVLDDNTSQDATLDSEYSPEFTHESPTNGDSGRGSGNEIYTQSDEEISASVQDSTGDL